MRNHTPDSASVRKYQRLNELRLAVLDRTERDYRLLDTDDNDVPEPFVIDDRFNYLYESGGPRKSTRSGLYSEEGNV